MARARNIKPGFFSNDLLAEINPLGRLLFAGLWTLADRAGRLEDRPKKIKAEVLPYDACNVDKLLTELQARSFIQRYVVRGLAYIQILNFTKHQNPHKNEAESTIPAPEQHSAEPMPEPEQNSSNRADSLIPDSGFPRTDSGFPSNPVAGGASPPPARKKRVNGETPPSVAVWEAYSDAYRTRYGVDPTRNASVNAQIGRFVSLVPAEDAPAIAAFYVEHNRRYYVEKQHPAKLLMQDAEGLRTEWLTGRKTTETEARQADRTQTNLNVWGKLIAEAEAHEGKQDTH
jgi:hypothetical protein